MIAGVCVLPESTPCTLLVSQLRSPVTKLSKTEILLQNRSGRGMPYIMAILDDVVTSITPVVIPEQAASPADRSAST